MNVKENVISDLEFLYANSRGAPSKRCGSDASEELPRGPRNHPPKTTEQQQQNLHQRSSRGAAAGQWES
eukprot:scaffold1435_cov162-Ochromonas_danica.AAC.20